MVICIVALVVFSIMGIFSLTYRKLAKEAFECTFRMVTFRPCKSKLDERIRAKIISKLMRIPSLAKFVYKYFTTLSWIFVIIFFASLGYSAYGVYNLIVHGTCTPGSDNCPFAVANTTDCGCKDVCQCSKDTCSSPGYIACKGNCTCQIEVCSKKQ
jgi:hypothetical protein